MISPRVRCTGCLSLVAFQKLVSVRPNGTKKDNIFLCPVCGHQHFDVRHLNPYRKQAA